MNSEKLKQVLADHRLWLSSNRTQGKRANLTGANLYEANLTDADLSWANLTGADLSKADLHRANLNRANLSEANLSGANLSGANLTGANLTGAELGPQIRECLTFEFARVSEDQLAWLCLDPKFGEWRDSLTIVPASETEAPTT